MCFDEKLEKKTELYLKIKNKIYSRKTDEYFRDETVMGSALHDK